MLTWIKRLFNRRKAEPGLVFSTYKLDLPGRHVSVNDLNVRGQITLAPGASIVLEEGAWIYGDPKLVIKAADFPANLTIPPTGA